MTADLKPCPKCGDGSSEYGCDLCIGETTAPDPEAVETVAEGEENYECWYCRDTLVEKDQQLAAANAAIERLKEERADTAASVKRYHSIIGKQQATMAQMAEALDGLIAAVDKPGDRVGMTAYGNAVKARDAYRKLIGEK